MSPDASPVEGEARQHEAQQPSVHEIFLRSEAARQQALSRHAAERSAEERKMSLGDVARKDGRAAASRQQSAASQSAVQRLDVAVLGEWQALKHGAEQGAKNALARDVKSQRDAELRLGAELRPERGA